ncbi:MAG: threonine/serine dehydratase [Rhodospirillaceae bacterium]|jgi:threonine dehydratase
MDGPNFSDIQKAAARLENLVVRTPLIEIKLSNKGFKRVFLKLENFQKTGSFKFRGAYNKIIQLNDKELRGGVTAYSSGNHAQAVACVAQMLGIKAVIVMPEDAPTKKMDATLGFGAEIVTYNRWRESREAIAGDIALTRGMTLVPPFDDPSIIAGQGTVGFEICEDLKSLDLTPDLVVVPASGGGLVSGVALGVKNFFPDTQVFSVEPEHFDDIARSLSLGERITNRPEGRNSICDALLVPTPGDITLPMMQKLLSGGLSVSEESVRRAMQFAWLDQEIMLEPGGAVGLAALSEGLAPESEIAVVVCSGGNVDETTFHSLIEN